MTYTTVNISVDGGIGHLRLNRPQKANAMNLPMWDELPLAIAELGRDASVRVVILSGEGRHFCAGIDVEALAHLAQLTAKGCAGRAREQVLTFIEHAQAAFTAVEQLRVPVIAAVHGACVGAGVDLIGACDIRIASSDARFCIKEVDLAVVPDVGTVQRLRHIIGYGRLTELTLTAETFDAGSARDWGLVTRLYADSEALMEGADALAHAIAAKSPLAVRGIKRNLLWSREHGTAEGLSYAASWNAAMLISDDAREALMAQMEKRAPQFED